MKPYLSIIIPFFGNADSSLLERCLASIRTQDIAPSDYEIIVCDEGQGHGVYAARNEGMKQAHGEYLFFVDADDWIYPGTLKICLDVLKKAKPDMLTFGHQRVSADSTAVPKQPELKTTRYSSGAFFMAGHSYFGVIWRFMIRRETVEKNQLRFIERRHHQDEIFCAECYFVARSLIDLNTIVYAYCQHKNSLVHKRTREFRERRIADYRNILTELQRFGDMHPQKSRLQADALKRRIQSLTICYVLELLRNRCTPGLFFRELRLLRRDHFLPLKQADYNRKIQSAQYLLNFISWFFR